MNLVTGDRVEVSCVNYYYGPLLFEESTLSPEQRRGVIVSGVEEDSIVTSILKGIWSVNESIKTSIVVALDYPLNTQPRSEEIKTSKKYKIPGEGTQIIIIKKEIWRLKFVQLKLLRNNAKLGPESICYCLACNGFKRRAEMLKGCQSSHFFCAEHLIYWDNLSHAPQFEEGFHVYRLLAQGQALSSRRQIYCIETTSLLMAKQWNRYNSDEDKQRFVAQLLVNGLAWKCPACTALGFSVRESTLHLKYLEESLFPSEETILSYRASALSAQDSQPAVGGSPHVVVDQGTVIQANASRDDVLQAVMNESLASYQSPKKPLKALSPAVRQELIDRKINPALIEKLERENPDDCESMDANFAEAIIASLTDITETLETMAISEHSNIELLVADIPSITFPRLAANVEVLVASPRSVKSEPQRLVLRSGMSYADIAAAALRLVSPSSAMVSSDDLCIYILRPTTNPRAVAWRDEVSSTAENPSDDEYAVSIRSIQQNSIIEIRTVKDNVGPPLLLRILAADFRHNASMVDKVNRLSSAYIGFRRIRGDGNCYYRAAIFGLLEQIIESGQRRRFLELHAYFSQYFAEYDSLATGSKRTSAPSTESSLDEVYEDSLWQTQIDRFLKALIDASENKIWVDVADFEMDILQGVNASVDIGMDDAMIRACRRLVSAFLMKHKFTEVNGIAITDAILPSFPDCSTMKEYCATYVDRMGVDAEGPFVYLGVIFIALRCYGLTVFFDRRKDVVLNFFETNPAAVPQAISATNYGGCVHLLLRPGHYDLLRPCQANKRDGRPALGVEDLAQLCNTVPKRLERAVSNNDSTNPQAADEIRAILNSSIARMLNADFPSLAAKLSGFDAGVDLSFHLQSFNRVVLGSSYSALCQAGGAILHTSDSFTLPRAQIIALKGTDSELLEYARKKFRIRAGDEMHLRQLQSSATAEIEAYCVCVRSSVKLQIDCSDVELLPSTTRPVADSNIFTVTLDLSVYNSAELILKRLIRLLDLPLDCYLNATESIMSDINDLAEVQMIEPGYEFTLKLLQGSLVIAQDRNGSVFANFRIPIETNLSSLKSTLAAKLGIPKSVPMLVVNTGDGRQIDSDSACKLLFPKAVIMVVFCHACVGLHEDEAGSREGGAVLSAVDIIRLTSCPHDVCDNCLSRCLQSSMVNRPALDAAYRTDAVAAQSLHKFTSIPSPPVSADMIADLPQLISTIACPVSGCRCKLSEHDIASHPIVVADFSESLTEMEEFIRFLASFRDCCLNELTFCDMDPVDKLIQLGCNHFFHKECLVPYLRQQVETGRSAPDAAQLICYECHKKKLACDCLSCSGRSDLKESDALGHIYTELEVQALVGDGFSETDKDNWDRLSNMISARRMFNLIACKQCGGSFNIDERLARQTELTCPHCRYTMCTQCQQPAHPDISCADNSKRIRRQEIQNAGIRFIQPCPFCERPWDVPINCLHVTCEGAEGCGRAYCFLCAASYTPTVHHGTWYHRPQCTFYNTQCDCDPPCLKDDPLTVCAKSKYWPGPCADCRAAETVNDCNHTPWRACSTCVGRAVPCTHWCDDCSRLGSLCSPPGNPPDPNGPNGFKFEVFPHADVSEEQKRLEAPKADEAEA